MKKLFLFTAMFAAAGLLTTSCSSDSVSVEQPEVSLVDRFDAQGKARVYINIKTPSNSGTTRAGEVYYNDNLVSATAEENTINSALLIVFAGTEEATAKFQGAYTLTAGIGSGSGYDVDKLYSATINSEGIGSSDKLYALVVANVKGLFTQTAGNNLTVTGKETYTPTKAATTFAQFQKYELLSFGDPTGATTDTDKGMLMSNAPLSSVANPVSTALSGTPKLTTLVEIASTNIQNSEDEAKTHAIDVFVERAAAKVQVTYNITTKNKVGKSDIVVPAEGNFKWVLDNLEPTFYAVRNMPSGLLNQAYSGSNYYRFLAKTAETNSGTGASLYRTYWAEDPHYNYSTYNIIGTETKTNNFSELTKKEAGDITNDLTGSGGTPFAYLNENTMNYNGITRNRTTRVLISIDFGDSFYTTNDADEILAADTDGRNTTVETRLKDFLLSQTAIQTYLTTYEGGDADKLTVKIGVNSSNKPELTVTGTNTESAATTALASAVTAAKALDALSVKYYKDGRAYYAVRIRHFSNDEAPLGAITGSDYVNLYGTGTPKSITESGVNQNFLGRYGVVRNNWYIIQINEVRHIGSPDIPDYVEPTDDPDSPNTIPDDETEQFLSTTIYVTKWAQRTQAGRL